MEKVPYALCLIITEKVSLYIFALFCAFSFSFFTTFIKFCLGNRLGKFNSANILRSLIFLFPNHAIMVSILCGGLETACKILFLIISLCWQNFNLFRKESEWRRNVLAWTSGSRLLNLLTGFHLLALSLNRGILSIFFLLLCTVFNTASSDSTVSEDVGIEPRAVATSALAVRRSNR